MRRVQLFMSKVMSSNCHIVSLDAAKAFEKVWRDGLFEKLKPVTDPCTWRLLHRYYEESFAVVGLEGFRIDQAQVFSREENALQA